MMKRSHKLATKDVGKIRLVKIKIANILYRKLFGKIGLHIYVFLLLILG